MENFDLKKFEEAVKAGNKRTDEQTDVLIEMALGNLHGSSTDVVLTRSLNENDEFVITSVAANSFTPEGTEREIWTPKFGTDLGGTVPCKWFKGVGATNYDIAKFFAKHANVTKFIVKEKKTDTTLSRDNKPYQRTTYVIEEKAK